MKVRSNPKHSPAAVMWPFLRGVYVGASVDVEASKKAGAPRYKFDEEPVDLGADFFKRAPLEYAYFVKKVLEEELLAADEEMAEAAGVKLEVVSAAKAASAEIRSMASDMAKLVADESAKPGPPPAAA
ncbi:MAG TPA: hypothetical protein VGH28_13850 [Polyangiaceae bacterium]|jgi:hypothetical protein